MKRFKAIKNILLSLGLILIVGLVGWSLRHESDYFIVDETPVEIEFDENHEVILDLLKSKIEPQIKALKGVNIWQTQLSAIQNSLLGNEWVEKVVVQRKLPNKIHIKLDLESIAFLYMDQQNKIHPITKSGKVLSVIPSTITPIAPILRNSKVSKNLELRTQLINLLSEVPNIDALKIENIAEVDFQPVTGLTLELINERATVHLGSQDIQTKGLQVLRVTDYLKSQKQKARVIDASFSKKVLVRLRKRS